ncbi:proline transporter 1-like [Rhodamnia argentea]|uniref:Proline transporter 1-like n=1 Tax=Rhodamnia argentea TaxID=178133 RepID=A0A8B8P953_9MYRT|nr:proline transporter 1-like [Rhodamnia argentea]
MHAVTPSAGEAMEALSLEPAQVNEHPQDHHHHHHQQYASLSAHTTDHDSWLQVGLLLVTGFNCGYVLSFSNLMLVPLGWTWGIICLSVVGLYTAYANWLLAAFHFVDGRRFIRYRDIMGFLFGRQMYYITWVFQFLTLLLGNMGFILLGGKALKAINSEFSESPLRLQYYIGMTGAAYLAFACLIPTMSAMRSWLGVSTVLTFTYIGLLLMVVIKDGKSDDNKNYDLKRSKVGQAFGALGAVSATIVCNASGLLLEIQSTLRKPAVENMRKAMGLQYTVGLIVYYGVTVAGYWAYGSGVSEYLPEELSGPKWAKVFINSSVFLQSIISQHIFVAPIHETLDTKFLKLEESMNSATNLKRRMLLRAALFAVNTFVTAAFPFMGDFVNFFGSFTLIPLTFVFPSLIFLKVKGKKARLEKKVWHCFNVVVFSLLAVAATIAAVRLIVDNTRTYSFFADT